MKNLKLINLCIVASLLLFAACTTEDKLIDELEATVERGAVLRTVQVVSPAFDLFDLSSVWEVVIEEQDAEGGSLFQEIKIYIGFKDNTPGNGTTTASETFVKSVSASEFASGPFGFPRGNLSLSFQQSLDALGLQLSDVDGSDQIVIRLELFLTDGRVYTNDAGGTVTGGSFYRSPFQYSASLVCPSNLEGTHSFVSTNLVAAYGGPCPTGSVTGTVTWTALGGGNYLVSDLGFGQYESSCWNDTPATSSGAIFVEACGLVISGGLDQYGLTYIWVITDVSGPNLSISWTNDYGDGGDVVLTREGGVDWPPLFTN